MMLKMRGRDRLLKYRSTQRREHCFVLGSQLTVALVRQTWPHPLCFYVFFVPVVGVIARFWGFGGAMLGLSVQGRCFGWGSLRRWEALR